MTNRQIVRWTNRLALFSIILLLYGILIFSVNTIFDLKILRAHSTEAFALSVVGLLALLAGTLVVNVMLNLTRLAEKADSAEVEVQPRGIFKWILLFLLSVVLIISAMFAGDYYTKSVKRDLMLNTAQQLIREYRVPLDNYARAPFGIAANQSLSAYLALMAKKTEFVSDINLLRQENVLGRPMTLAINAHSSIDLPEQKQQNPHALIGAQGDMVNALEYVFKATHEQQTYLQRVFKRQTLEPLYIKQGGSYQLFYPIDVNGRVVVLYLTDYQAYGKASY